METLHRFFVVFQYFAKILPFIESLWCALQDEVYIVDCSAAGGLWRHLGSYPKLEIIKKTGEIEHFVASHVKYEMIKTISAELWSNKCKNKVTKNTHSMVTFWIKAEEIIYT